MIINSGKLFWEACYIPFYKEILTQTNITDNITIPTNIAIYNMKILKYNENSSRDFKLITFLEITHSQPPFLLIVFLIGTSPSLLYVHRDMFFLLTMNISTNYRTISLFPPRNNFKPFFNVKLSFFFIFSNAIQKSIQLTEHPHLNL